MTKKYVNNHCMTPGSPAAVASSWLASKRSVKSPDFSYASKKKVSMSCNWPGETDGKCVEHVCDFVQILFMFTLQSQLKRLNLRVFHLRKYKKSFGTENKMKLQQKDM